MSHVQTPPAVPSAQTRRTTLPGARRPPRGRAPACEWLDRSLRSRCESSWRQLLSRCGPRIRYLVSVIAREHGLRASQGEVEELCQELYLFWLGRGTSFDGRSARQFWRFVSASIRHLVIDQVRRVTAEKRSPACDPWARPLSVEQLERAGVVPVDESISQPVHRLAWGRGGSPENRLIVRQEVEALWHRFAAACRAVVDDELAVAVLAGALLDGHSSAELSHALRRAGRPTCKSTIDSWVYRLRKNLVAQGLRLPKRERNAIESTWSPRLGDGMARHTIVPVRGEA